MPIDRAFVALPSPTMSRAGAGGHPGQGIYHTPRGQEPKVAIIATHYQVDFAEHYLASYMAERGIGFLGWNTRYRGDDSKFLLDHALVDIGVGVRWLREEANVDAVILLGNSGGGSLMAAYQSQAVEHNITAVADTTLAAGVDELLPADGYISSAAHTGRPDVLTAWLDPSVTREDDPTSTDQSLYLWNPDNGPSYSPDFLERYRAAQVARNHRITAWVLSEIERLKSAGFYEETFSIPRTWADPRMVDPTLEPSARRPNWCYRGEPEASNKLGSGIGQACQLRTWLSMWSLEHSQARAEPHLARVTVPALVINADADTGVFPSDAQRLHDAIASTDKERYDLTGDHYFMEPAGARDAQADLVRDWIGKRFL